MTSRTFSTCRCTHDVVLMIRKEKKTKQKEREKERKRKKRGLLEKDVRSVLRFNPSSKQKAENESCPSRDVFLCQEKFLFLTRSGGYHESVLLEPYLALNSCKDCRAGLSSLLKKASCSSTLNPRNLTNQTARCSISLGCYA